MADGTSYQWLPHAISVGGTLGGVIVGIVIRECLRWIGNVDMNVLNLKVGDTINDAGDIDFCLPLAEVEHEKVKCILQVDAYNAKDIPFLLTDLGIKITQKKSEKLIHDSLRGWLLDGKPHIGRSLTIPPHGSVNIHVNQSSPLQNKPEPKRECTAYLTAKTRKRKEYWFELASFKPEDGPAIITDD